MAGRPGALPWNVATFTGNEPVSRLSDNFNFLNAQINDSGAGFTNYAPDTGTANNLIVTLASAPVAYEAGMMVCTVPAFTSTGASVINVNALGNIPIVNPANVALQGGEISANALLTLVYDGTSFRIIGPCILAANFPSVGSQSVNCAGYTSISISINYAVASSTLTLNHLGTGVPIFIVLTNSVGGASAFGIGATNAQGAAVTTVSVLQSGQANGTTFTAANGYIVFNNYSVILQGMLIDPTVLLLSH